MTTRQFEALQVSTDDLFISPINVRREIDDVSELAQSIREQGVLEPLVVRRTSDGKFEVIIGSRRLTASRQIGLNLVPVVVQDISDADAVLRSLAENIQRQNLSLEERVQAYKTLKQLEPERFENSRGLARAIGRGRSNIDSDFEAYEALTRLRPRGVSVRQSTSPQSSERQSGDVIPTAHAAMIQQAISAVSATLPTETLDDTYEELARNVAPLEQDRARRVLDYFKMYPDRPIREVVSMALATVERQISLPAETARKLEELAGASDWNTVLEGLVEERVSEVPPTPALNLGGQESGTQEHLLEPDLGGDEDRQARFEPFAHEEDPQPRISAADDGEIDSEIRPGPHALQGTPTSHPAELSGLDATTGRISQREPTNYEQINERTLWNLGRTSIMADIFTIGYSQKTISHFVRLLKKAKVTRLIDIRNNPQSQYRPEFSQGRLAEELTRHEIEYVHRGDLGVPSEIRTSAEAQSDRSQVWDWYRENVVPKIHAEHVGKLIGESEGRVAFMCVEINPQDCHRHILVEEFEPHGYKCFDL